MSATVPYAEARRRLSAEDWKNFVENPNRWGLKVGDQEFPPGTDFVFASRFGEVRSAVVIQPGGASFDRPEYTEAPFMQTIVWGQKDGMVYIGMVEQARPHADEPDKHGEDGHDPVLFMHCPMGFNEKAATGKFETPEEAAKREAGEEMGVRKILGTEKVLCGHNPTPSFTPTWGGVAFVQVDLDAIIPPEQSLEEPIAGTYFIEAGELLEMIASGKSPRGAYTGVSTSLSALMLFFAVHPEYFPL